MNLRSKKGFTIVELVIVIAVIAILAAVLIPTFSSVTSSAKASAAQQQAKAGLDSVLALTGGVLPEGSLFAVTDDDDAKADYWFAYQGNKLQQVDINTAPAGGTYPEVYESAGSVYTYAVYVSASCWIVDNGGSIETANSADADKNRLASSKLIASVLDQNGEGKETDTLAVFIPNAKTLGASYFDGIVCTKKTSSGGLTVAAENATIYTMDANGLLTLAATGATVADGATYYEVDANRKIKVFYTTDIQNTQCIFIGSK